MENNKFRLVNTILKNKITSEEINICDLKLYCRAIRIKLPGVGIETKVWLHGIYSKTWYNHSGKQFGAFSQY